MILLLIAAAIPVVFLCTMIYIKDTEREPIKPLVQSFACGMFIIIPVLIVGII